ncbi:MAG: hypothetical protein WCD52_13145 [Xanthobacteraceae bacterium]
MPAAPFLTYLPHLGEPTDSSGRESRRQTAHEVVTSPLLQTRFIDRKADQWRSNKAAIREIPTLGEIL